MRVSDFTITLELLRETQTCRDGARNRVIDRHQFRKSVLTDAVARIERHFDAKLFGGSQRRDVTPAGRYFLTEAPKIVAALEAFTAQIALVGRINTRSPALPSDRPSDTRPLAKSPIVDHV